MSKRKPSLILNDILQCIRHIEQYTQSLSFDTFIADFMVIEACLYNLQVIGEATTQLTDDIKQSSPKIPWALMKGMRNRLIHEYFGTDFQLVWNVITKELPALQPDLQSLHQQLITSNR